MMKTKNLGIQGLLFFSHRGATKWSVRTEIIFQYQLIIEVNPSARNGPFFGDTLFEQSINGLKFLRLTLFSTS